jgi:hypothetical protein
VEDKMIGDGIKYRPSPSEKDKRMRSLFIKEQRKIWKIKCLPMVKSTASSSLERRKGGEARLLNKDKK